MPSKLPTNCTNYPDMPQLWKTWKSVELQKIRSNMWKTILT